MGTGIAYGLIAILGFGMTELRKRIEALELEIYILKQQLEDRE